MPNTLAKLLKKNAKVATDHALFLKYELTNPKYNEVIIPLEADYEIGIEIEIERIKHHNVTHYPVWQMKTDGSLRDNGFEYVSHPIAGPRIHYALNAFFGLVNAGFRFSPRTSIHVHLNALDMTPAQVGGLLMTYIPFERLLYKFVGGDRDKNNFCVPMLDTINSGPITTIKSFVQDDWELPNYDHIRYMGLNLDSLRKFGSLEFRHLGGTADKHRIVKWINLIFCLKKYAMANSWQTIHDRVCRLNTDSAYSAFFNDVWGQCGKWLDASRLQKDMEYGVSRVKKVMVDDSWKTSIWSNYKGTVWHEKLHAPKASPATFEFNQPPRGRAGRAGRLPEAQPAVRLEARVEEDDAWRYGEPNAVDPIADIIRREERELRLAEQRVPIDQMDRWARGRGA